MLQKWGLADSESVAAATSTVASAAHKKVPLFFFLKEKWHGGPWENDG